MAFTRALCGLLVLATVFEVAPFTAAATDADDAPAKDHVLPLEPLYKGAREKVVINLSPQEFEDRVIKNTSDQSVWMVQFYAHWCDVCKEMAPLYNNVAQAMDGVVKVAAVNLGDEEDEGGTVSPETKAAARAIADKFNVDEYPHILLFGHDRSKPTLYNRAQKDMQSLVQAAMDAVIQTITLRVNNGVMPEQPKKKKSEDKKKPEDKKKKKKKKAGKSRVVDLTQKNIKDQVYEDSAHVWMVAFIAPWCGHCKALLPDWHAASRQLHGHGVKLGLVDATVETELAQQYGVQGYPTIKLFSGIGPAARKKGVRTATTYEGGRTKDQIIFGALDEVEKSGGFTKEIMELTSPQVLEEACEGEDGNKLCLIVALPHILESGVAGREKYLSLMQNVTKSVLSGGVAAPFEFVWFEGGNAQTDLEGQLELSFGYPAVAAVSVEKEAYAIHRGAFSHEKLKNFLNGILSGRQKVSPLNTGSTGLKVSKTEPWDGSEGSVPEEEDLSDIMGDDWQSDL